MYDYNVRDRWKGKKSAVICFDAGNNFERKESSNDMLMQAYLKIHIYMTK